MAHGYFHFDKTIILIIHEKKTSMQGDFKLIL